MFLSSHTRWALLLLAAGGAAPALAQGFAPAGAKATLSVEYRFEAEGRKADKYDSWVWKVSRRAELVAELAARKPMPLPAMHTMEAAQSARLGQQQAQMQRAATEMAPMMAGAQAIMEKCGDDEKCMEREATRMGLAMAGTPQAAAAQRTGHETAEVMKPGADRYQIWEARTQKGTYALEESWQVVHADPICMKLPGARCRHDMQRKGGANFAPSGSPASVELDAQRNTMVLRLPVPLAIMAYTETQTTDEPEGTHETPTPRGPKPGQLMMRLTADGKSDPPPLKVALKGGWRSQSGEQVIPMSAGGWHGGGGDGGKLVVRWKFTAQ